MPPAPEKAPPGHDDDSPGLPGFRTWRGVYFFIAAAFVFYVVFLAVLPRLFA